MTETRPTITDLRAAADRIGGMARHTPLVASDTLSRALGATVRLKLETTQDTGTFKIRGAANVILAARERGEVKGVVTYSTGNHGRAVSHIASMLGLDTIVCLSSNTTQSKRDSIQQAGAELRVVGESQDEAAVEARRLVDEGLLLVDPINDPLTSAGQGTIGLEIIEDWPQVDTVVVPVSGGGLMAGIALAVKTHLPHVQMIGVSMDRGAAMYQSIAAGKPVEVPEVESLADSLQGGIGLDNTHTFGMVRELVDHLVLVDEDEIAQGMVEALDHEQLVLEGAGASPIAALMFRDRSLFGDNVALVATGSSVDSKLLCGLAEKHRDAVNLRLEEMSP